MTNRTEKLFTFRSGGWVILLALMVSIALTTWAIMPVLLKNRPPGDGQNIDSYGFDLSTLLIDREQMATPLLHRDMLPRMDHPEILTAAQARLINQEQRGKYLVSTDRVIGVEINGEARAYPISLLTVHEIINDTVGGQPIAVTYSWPGDAVRVFDRTIDGEVIELGISGLLYNANMLMYDRRDDDPNVAYDQRGESLWVQLRGDAVSGPAAHTGQQLRTIAAQVVSWSHWQQLHPDTTVVARDPQLIKRYRRAEPRQYFISAEPPPYPVSPLPSHGPTHGPTHGPDLKDRVVVIATGEQRRVYPMSLIARHAASERGSSDGERRTWSDTLGDVSIVFTHDPAANTVGVDASSEIDVIHCLWFAWHALHPDDALAE